MKKIFINAHYLYLGGAETALIGLLHAIDYEKYDVDLFLESHEGELLQYVPEQVNLLPEVLEYSMVERPLKEAMSNGCWKVVAARLYARIAFEIYKRRNKVKDNTAIYSFTGKYLAPILPNVKHVGVYDIAINFIGQGCIVQRKIRTRKTIGWIHTDYSTVDVNYELSYPGWAKFDLIASISPDCTKAFLKTYPKLADKIVEIENILPKALVEKKAQENSMVPEFRSSIENENELTLLSVGRICEAKNYNNIPYMAAELKKLFMVRGERLEVRERYSEDNSSINHKPYTINHFHWYIVGPGDHSAIDALSKELGVDDVVAFLGPSSNPYPYIKACDIYVHPSRYEGKSIVVREAQILCKPVIITNFPTAKSQINHGVDGIICELDNKKIAEAIYQLAIDKTKQQTLITYLQENDFSGMNEVEKIYKLIS